jgi:hypothetical protein
VTAAPARAQPTPEPPLDAPVAQSSTEVPYPPDAAGGAAVLLELLVEKDGLVSSATPVGWSRRRSPAVAPARSWPAAMDILARSWAPSRR